MCLFPWGILEFTFTLTRLQFDQMELGRDDFVIETFCLSFCAWGGVSSMSNRLRYVAAVTKFGFLSGFIDSFLYPLLGSKV